jgi:hypothetical protein
MLTVSNALVGRGMLTVNEHYFLAVLINSFVDVHEV